MDYSKIGGGESLNQQQHEGNSAGGYWRHDRRGSGGPVWVNRKKKESVPTSVLHFSSAKPASFTTLQGRSFLQASKGNQTENNRDDLVQDYVPACPICLDPLIEATVNSCGHLFCHDCIHEWKKVKNQCPICQEQLTYGLEDSLSTFPCATSKLARVPEMDQVIEKHLVNLPPEVRARFYARQRARMSQEKRPPGLRKRFIKRIEDVRLYFQSKGFLRGIGRKLVITLRSFVELFSGFSFKVVTLIMLAITAAMLILLLGFVLGATMTDSANGKYLLNVWKAIMTYPVPEPVQNHFDLWKYIGYSMWQ